MNSQTLIAACGEALAQNEFLERLVFASLQLGVLAIVVTLTGRFLLRRMPRLMALLWVVVMAKAVIALCLGAPLQIPVAQSIAPTPLAAAQPALQPAPFQPSAFQSPVFQPPIKDIARPPETVAPSPQPQPSSPTPPQPAFTFPARPDRFAIGLWMVGLLLFLALGAADRVRFGRLLRHTSDPSEKLRKLYAHQAARLELKKTPALRVTTLLESPAIAGILRPKVLVPHWMTEDLDEVRLAWTLRHELSHWKARDPLANGLRQLFQTLFFFHPLAWWAGHRWKEAMELACDRALVRTEEETTEYVEALYEMLSAVQQRRRFALHCGLFATRTQLGRRITALASVPLRFSGRMSRVAAVSLAAFAVACFSVGAGLAPADDVSIQEEEAAINAPRVELTDTPSTEMFEDTDEALQLEEYLKERETADAELFAPWDMSEAEIKNASTLSLLSHFAHSPVSSYFGAHNDWNAAIERMCRSSKTLKAFLAREDVAEAINDFYRTYPYSGKFVLPEAVPWPPVTIDALTKPSGHPSMAAAMQQREISLVERSMTLYNIAPLIRFPRIFGRLKGHEKQLLSTLVQSHKKIEVARAQQKEYDYGAGASGIHSLSRALLESLGNRLSQSIVNVDRRSPTWEKDYYQAIEAMLQEIDRETEMAVSVSARILDDSGQPVAGASVVRLRHRIGTLLPDGDAALSDKAGRFTLENVTDETQVVLIEAAGLSTHVAELPGGAETPGIVPLAKGMGLHGKVIDEKKQPVAGVSVRVLFNGMLFQGRRVESTLARWKGLTDEDGAFRIEDTAGKRLLLDFRKDGYGDHRVGLTPQSEVHIVSMEAHRKLRIQATDAETDAPVGLFTVEAGLVFGGAYPEPAWAKRPGEASKEGVYAHTLPEHYNDSETEGLRLRLQYPGYYPLESPLFPHGDEIIEWQARMASIPPLTGMVLSPDGQPAAGAQVATVSPNVMARIENGEIIEQAGAAPCVSDENGRFSIAPGSEPYTALIVLHSSGQATLEEMDHKRPMTIRLAPWARVEGQAFLDAHVTTDAEVRLAYYTTSNRTNHRYRIVDWVKPDAQGRFVLEQAWPRRARLSLQPKGVEASREVLILSDKYRRVAMKWTTFSKGVRLQPATTLTTSLGLEGRPLVGRLPLREDVFGEVNLESSSGLLASTAPKPEPEAGRSQELSPWYAVTIHTDGRFSLPHVEAGPYHLSIVLSDGEGGPFLGSATTGFDMPAPQADDGETPFDLGEVSIEWERGHGPPTTGRIEGIIDLSGEHPAGEKVNLYRLNENGFSGAGHNMHDGHEETSTDAEGRFVLEDVPTGWVQLSRWQEYTVKRKGRIDPGSKTSQQRVVFVEAGKTLHVVLGGPHTAVGRMVAPTDFPIQIGWQSCDWRMCYPAKTTRATKELSPEEQNTWRSTYWNSSEGRAERMAGISVVPIIHEDGTFTVPGLRPGDYQLQMDVADHESEGPSWFSDGHVHVEFTVPESDEAVTIDLGDLEVVLEVQLQPGYAMPHFEAVTPEGQSITPESLRGSLVLLRFRMPRADRADDNIRAIKERYRQPGAESLPRIVTIAKGDDRDKLQAWLEKAEPPWTTAFVEKDFNHEELVLRSFPYHVLLDAEGRVLQHGSDLEHILAAAESLMAQ
jgi:beta-lactamase regulating signal transducer with metallopeptidase domain